jgi:S1-C subfamily serine protease
VAGQQFYVGGDLIISIGSERIRTMDDLSSYLEVQSVPGQTVNFTVVRDGSSLTLPVVIGVRP